MDAIITLKDQVRREAAARRRALDPGWRAEASARIAALASAQPWFATAREVSLYVGARDEVDTRPLIAETLRTKGGFHAPRVEPPDSHLTLYHAQEFPSGFVAGAFGLLEPSPEVWPKSDPPAMDLIFTPGLAFDRAGRRIGYGKGCYDRLFLGGGVDGAAKVDEGGLRRGRALRVGLAFWAQLFESLPEEPHDVRLDYIITEAEVIKTS